MCKSISHSRYMGHFCGALAGFLVGLVLLENRKVRQCCKGIDSLMTSSRLRCGR